MCLCLQAGFAAPAEELDYKVSAATAAAESVKDLLARLKPYTTPGEEMPLPLGSRPRFCGAMPHTREPSGVWGTILSEVPQVLGWLPITYQLYYQMSVIVVSV